MLLASFPAGPFAANCYLVGAETECVIVDPGMDATDGVVAALERESWRPVAIFLTHGHIDHVASAAPLAARFGLECFVHAADRLLLTEPAGGLSPQTASMLVELIGGTTLTEPERLRFVEDGDTFDVAGCPWTVVHAPGHTPGSVLYRTPYPDHAEISELAFTGDVLFAGSIGRTDLPGGDPEAMRRSLIDRVLPLPDGAAVLPGHGDTSSMGFERATNPYLQPSFLRN
ncbi:MAG: MBL fold metallo-hydrolase [Propionibacteriaceae bacterium]|nr:MBL fold metallo-hydrolase [Micropruina sp.]HBX81931.1 MBL fold metallo-hydrolase [Propionibacteriaceae bacterium]HBY22739.1 MBL fold metallo-hydrolase [Propionibacteriaceae bacterium]